MVRVMLGFRVRLGVGLGQISSSTFLIQILRTYNGWVMLGLGLGVRVRLRVRVNLKFNFSYTNS